MRWYAMNEQNYQQRATIKGTFKALHSKLQSLLNRVGCVVTWVTWVSGCVGFVGQIFMCVAWVTWVKIFFTWLIIVTLVTWAKYVFAWVKMFLRGSFRGSKTFMWVQNFCVGQLLFTRPDYFTILQLIAYRIFSRFPSQQIFTKPCLTSLVFFSSLLAKVDLGPLQRFRLRFL